YFLLWTNLCFMVAKLPRSEFLPATRSIGAIMFHCFLPCMVIVEVFLIYNVKVSYYLYKFLSNEGNVRRTVVNNENNRKYSKDDIYFYIMIISSVTFVIIGQAMWGMVDQSRFYDETTTSRIHCQTVQ
ncbi:hypothetical protein PFISCL1PPCAC_4299, partial [Pristionchus fissidentatus]